MLAPALLACLLCPISPAAARSSQDQQPSPPQTQPAPVQEAPKQAESYRLRIANTLYGAVEISTDEGKSWTLIARVQKAAVTAAEGGASTAPSIERGSGNGIAFAIGGRRLLRILPDLPANYKNGSAIVISHAPFLGLFKDLMPPYGSPVQQIVNRRESAIPNDYVPQDGDILLITVPRSPITPDRLAEQVKLLTEKHRSGIVARLQRLGKKPTNGILTVTVNLAAGEKVSALTYFLNGEVVAIQNQAPFTLKLDTRRWANGEHVLEARAVDMSGAVLTMKKTLLFVENEPAKEGSEPTVSDARTVPAPNP
jgi:hypothetical protein